MATAATVSAIRFTRLMGVGLRARGRLLTAVRVQRRGLITATALLGTAELRPQGQGQPGTLDYRVFLVDGAGRKVSPWHDVPLRAADGAFHFVVEIPKESSAKMEVATDEAFTPIKQDTKKGILRYYPYNINWNYGLLPQTWEDPTSANSDVEGAFGDNDPGDADCHPRLVQRLQDTRWQACQQIWSWRQAHKQGICSEGHSGNQ